MKLLNVAQSPDSAKTIADFLSNGASRQEYEFDAEVNGEVCKMVMTSVRGHLLNFVFVNPCEWHDTDPASLFDEPIEKKCKKDHETIKETLEREIRECEGLIIWTDCDREGENIGFEIIAVCRAIKPNIQVHRAIFSEITADSVHRALKQLAEPDKRQSDAVDVRSEMDFRTGVAFTRLQSKGLQDKFSDKFSKNKSIRYGSCLIPTLGFVAERFKQVERFVLQDQIHLRGPMLLTEAELIGLMKKYSIGTKTTYEYHINRAKELGYIGVLNNGYLVPGIIGMGLYEGYNAMDLPLAQPALREEFEVDLKRICEGEKDPQAVLSKEKQKYSEIYEQMSQRIEKLFESMGQRLSGCGLLCLNFPKKGPSPVETVTFCSGSWYYKLLPNTNLVQVEATGLTGSGTQDSGIISGAVAPPGGFGTVCNQQLTQDPTVPGEMCPICRSPVVKVNFNDQILLNTCDGWYFINSQ